MIWYYQVGGRKKDGINNLVYQSLYIRLTYIQTRYIHVFKRFRETNAPSSLVRTTNEREREELGAICALRDQVYITRILSFLVEASRLTFSRNHRDLCCWIWKRKSERKEKRNVCVIFLLLVSDSLICFLYSCFLYSP